MKSINDDYLSAGENRIGFFSFFIPFIVLLRNFKLLSFGEEAEEDEEEVNEVTKVNPQSILSIHFQSPKIKFVSFNW